MAKNNPWTWRATQILVLGALLIGGSAVLIWTLEHLLPLTRRQSATISIDRGICDYLIAAVKARHGK